MPDKPFELPEIRPDPRRITHGDTSAGRAAMGDAVNDFRDAEKAPKVVDPD